MAHLWRWGLGLAMSGLLVLGSYIWQNTQHQIESMNTNGTGWSQTHIAVTDSELRQLNQRLDRIEQKLDQMNEREHR